MIYLEEKNQEKIRNSRGTLSERGIHEEDPILRRECSGCGQKAPPDDPGVVIFLCPNCGKGLIVRCSSCRKRAQVIKCPVCGFRYP